MGRIIEGIVSKYGYEESFVKARVERPNGYYGYFRIPKKGGGMRLINVPSADIKVFQRYILEEYLTHVAISPHAIAYVKGKNIKDNVLPHTKNGYFLHIDIKNFFYSMDRSFLSNILHQEQVFSSFDSRDFFELLQLSTYQNHFPQGAITSPAMSNIYFKNLDILIADLASHLPNGVYTRYSDDLTISSSSLIPPAFCQKIIDILSVAYLRPNREKSYLATTKRKTRITGLNISNQEISVGLVYKRSIRHDLYHLFGKNDKTIAFSVVKGKLEFLWSIDPLSYRKIYTEYQRLFSNKALALLFSHAKAGKDFLI